MNRRESKWALERLAGCITQHDWRAGRAPLRIDQNGHDPLSSSVESWDVERASAWLRQFPFGENLVRQLEADPEPERIQHFLMMVSRVHAAVNGTVTYRAPKDMPQDSEDDEFDVAMWPALIAGLYE